MNITKRKKLLKAFSIIQLVTLCLLVVFFALTLIFLHLFDKMYDEQLEFLNAKIIIQPIISIVMYAVYFTLMTIYLHKKRKQPKDEFLSKMKFLKIICFIDFIFDGLFFIILIVAAYKKDDGKEPIVKNKKEECKKNKVTHSKETKQKLRKEKSKRRKGLISQELYEKNVKKIIKEENHTKNED